MIKAIFFDAGGVLIWDGSEKIFDRQARLLNVERSRLVATMRPDRRRLSKGLISRREYLMRIERKLGTRKISALDLKEIFPAKVIYYRRALDVARRLWERGFIVGIITNVPPPHRFLPRAQFTYPPFKPIIQSYAVHAVKPERRIFDIARRRAGVEFSEMIFFDDKPANVATAKKLGIQAFVYKNPGELVRSLRRLGVSI